MIQTFQVSPYGFISPKSTNRHQTNENLILHCTRIHQRVLKTSKEIAIHVNRRRNYIKYVHMTFLIELKLKETGAPGIRTISHHHSQKSGKCRQTSISEKDIAHRATSANGAPRESGVQPETSLVSFEPSEGNRAMD